MDNYMYKIEQNCKIEGKQIKPNEKYDIHITKI